MKKFTILLLAFFGFSFANAQEAVISGSVSDSLSGIVLPGAHVYLQELKRGCITNSDGEFILSPIPSGEYSIIVSFLGYKTLRTKIKVDKGKNIIVHFKVQATAFTTGEVIVSGQSQKYDFAPGQVRIIKLESIAPSVSSTDEILNYLPGVYSDRHLGIYSDKPEVSIRGLGAGEQSRILVLIDGFPMNKSEGGSVNWNLFNSESLNQVKVVKGPGSARYGSNAMGGIIDLQTRIPADSLEGKIKLGYGTYNTFYSSAGFAKSIQLKNQNRIFSELSAWRRTSDGYINVPDSFITRADTLFTPVFLNEYCIQIRAGYSGKNDQSSDITALYYDDKRGRGIKVYEEAGSYSSHRTFQARLRQHLKAGIVSINNRAFYQVEAYNRIFEYIQEGEYSLYEVVSNRFDFGIESEASVLFSDKYGLLAGFEFRNGSVDGQDIYYSSTDLISNAGNVTTSSVFAENQLTLLKKKLKVNIGLRLDASWFSKGLYTIEYPSYSIEYLVDYQQPSMPDSRWLAACPRISARYEGKSIEAYLSLGKGFRSPVLEDMTRTGKYNGNFKIANPFLKPEYLYSAESGIELGNHKKKIGLAAFYSLGKDFMYYISTNDTVNMGYKLSPVMQMKNIGMVTISGFETEAEITLLNWLKLSSNYTYTNAFVSKYELINEDDFDLNGKYLAGIPAHKFSIGTLINYHDFTFSAHWIFTGPRWVNDRNSIDLEYLNSDQYKSYTTLNLKARYILKKHFSLTGSVDNLLDVKYINSNGLVNPGRFLMFELQYNL